MSLFYNLNNNFISLILKSAVFALTVYLISLVKATTLTLTIYLILTPYLTSSAENLIVFFEVFPEIAIMDNALAEFESLKSLPETRKVKRKISNFNLSVTDVCFSEDGKTGLKNINMFFPENTISLVVGEDSDGKKAILDLLQRKVKPSSGSIHLGGQNIFDFEKDEFDSLFSFMTKDPFFYSLSIAENLALVCKEKTKISKTLKQFGLSTIIENLSLGIDTIIDENFDKTLLFFLGLARAILSGAKIICIDETPNDLSSLSTSLLAKIFDVIKKDASLILFSVKQKPEIEFFEKFILKNGQIKPQKISQKP